MAKDTLIEVRHDNVKYYNMQDGEGWYRVMKCKTGARKQYVSPVYGETLTKEHKMQKAQNG